MLKIHALAHWLWKKRVPLIPRCLALFNRVVFAVQLPAQTQVGRGTQFGYSGLGTVIRSEALRRGGRYVSYGNLIVIRDTRNPAMKVYYAHLSQRDVRVGQTIRAGQTIGRSGYTGHVIPAGPRGAHLHYEIRIDGTPVDPIRILADHGVHP
jgi:hypothetical protein